MQLFKMRRSCFQLISVIKLHLAQSKIYCHSIKTNECIDLLNTLWFEKFIWGYAELNNSVKIYLKYKDNKPIINAIKFYTQYISVVKLKVLVRNYPQSLFILKTSKGTKSHNYCLVHNVAGLLVLKIN